VTGPTRGWLADLVVGGITGGVVGAIAAVNFVIFTGIEGGYEATIADVFEQNAALGVVTVAILIAGPVLGVALARRRRSRRERPSR
jgi:hypothetical protein